jgi:pimeloyl-ACP methyl ester carboxylesterase/membrane protein DedA with SNARE-associated domain
MRVLFYAYLILLLISHVVRRFQPDFNPRPDQITTTVLEVNGVKVGTRPVQISYVDSHPDDSTGQRPVIVLLHGSPMASSSLMRVHKSLAAGDSFRVITPDMPGFGGSSRTVSDYSVLAHAGYLIQLMDSLEIPTAHLVAYSMAGGIVIEMSRQAPAKVQSIIMLSAIGVQELELMGEYYLNHAVHGLQLGALWLVSEGIPHFGWMDDAILGKSYARNFFDTDQRPLRDILRHYDGPMEIIHGTDDPLVPYAAAVEHHRLVPQSELITLEGVGHGLPFEDPDAVARYIREFVNRVEAGAATSRADSLPERLRQADLPFDPGSIPAAKGFGLVILILLIVGATLVSEDLACIGAGLMAARGTLTLTTAFFAAFGGIVLGDILLYALGRSLGNRIVRRAPFSWFIHRDTLERGSAWFEQKGIGAIFASRFIPGTRLPTYVAAGVLRAPFWKFLFYFLIAAVLWTPAIVGLSTVLGNQILKFYEVYETYAIWVLLGLVGFLYGGVHLVVPAFTYRGRRLLISRWRRLTRWEFWSPLFFYPPVVAYVLWLAVRFRSLTAFAAANPGMPEGGFLGESKSQILRALSGASGKDVLEPDGIKSSEPGIARFTLVRNTQSGREEVESFMSRENLSYPVVLKPDVGERGVGVRIVHSTEEAESYFSENSGATIVQEFIDGREFGLFYYRYPGEPNGHIFSITEKRFLSVTGDGEHTIEELILGDNRAVCMANLHMSKHVARLSDIPDRNESVPLVDIGTHSLGALFSDGRGYSTPELRESLDRLSMRFHGFYFGRYDVRTSDLDEFRQGKGFTVLELNGVTSEATHIYDPDYSLLFAYRTLFQQWRIAFEIGRRNIDRGAGETKISKLFMLIIKYKLHRE